MKVEGGASKTIDPPLLDRLHRHRKLLLLHVWNISLPSFSLEIEPFARIEDVPTAIETSTAIDEAADLDHSMGLSFELHFRHNSNKPHFRINDEGLLAVFVESHVLRNSLHRVVLPGASAYEEMGVGEMDDFCPILLELKVLFVTILLRVEVNLTLGPAQISVNPT